MVEEIVIETHKPIYKGHSSALTTALKGPDQIRNNYSDYLKFLGIEKEDLGKTVLDIGSSVEEDFAIEASKNGIQVFSVNPQLINNNIRSERNSARRKLHDKKLKPESVAALSIALPFKDEIFDTVVSLYAFPYWVPHEDWEISFKEILRVLKPGGKGYFAPVYFPDIRIIQPIFKYIEGLEHSTKQIDYNGHPNTVLTITKPPKK